MADGRQNRAFRVGGRHRIIDDRRQVATMCEPSQLPDDSPPALVGAVEQGNAHRLSFVLRSSAITVLALMGAGVALSLVSLRIHPQVFATYSLWHRVLLRLGRGLLLCFPVALLLMSLHARRRGIEAIKALHAAGLCPSCAYDLRAVAPAADGCTVCPECGSAWKRPSPELPRDRT